jgi:hypothetical protein
MQSQEPVVATVSSGAEEPSDEIHASIPPVVKEQLQAVGLCEF